MITQKLNSRDVPTLTDVETELAAMQTVADTLAGLSDSGARARVLSWAAERFAAAGFDAPATVAAEPVGRVLTIVGHVKPSDPWLEVAGLEMLFDPEPDSPAGTVTDQPAAPVDEAEGTLLSVTQCLAEDFRKL